MANNLYLTIKGKNQGLISAGCSTYDSIGNRYQAGHEDQILVYSADHDISREQNVNHHPLIIKKPIDKSSPLLMIGVSTNEEMEVILDKYRTSNTGKQEKYYTVRLTQATLCHISSYDPENIPGHDTQSFEVISFNYQSIIATHHTAGTTGYSIWDERVY
ncbi:MULTISPECIES: Hcp family type VI secretion system effector [Rahnella]|jgi:hypothetical protein|uniref:Hcp family type VI secretion system effector n=1 Tax=Rahnella TaxID=34037 RepID=UPI000E6CCCC2|nr:MULTISPECIES: Hcp family type VI secretion system effector [Rahnella]TDS93095.1 hypothetical protein EDF78_104149 [Rahnella sp. BIGb0236]UHM92314.1 Hcp family type VI secretion system effector [Rahnella victoriana]VTQ56558.1 secreted protein Hcp [Campylobacter jejuni]